MAQKKQFIIQLCFFPLTGHLLIALALLLPKIKKSKLESQQEILYLKAVMQGKPKERVLIATKLHDGIVTELTIIKMKLEVNGTPSVNSKMPIHALQQLAGAINNVRNTVHNLMPEIVLRYNLPKSVKLLCSTIQKTGRLNIGFQQYGDFTQLKTTLRQSLYTMIQELLHNIIEHAQASQALVQLSCYGSLLAITIEDNGIGWISITETILSN